MSFFGSWSNEGRTLLTFDKKYSSRADMDAAIEGDADDGVFIGRFVLVEYSSDGPFTNKEEYKANFDKDQKKYINTEEEKPFPGYNSTLWRKEIDAEGKQHYVFLAGLSAKMPVIELREVAPGVSPQFNDRTVDLTDSYYVLNIPGNWGVEKGEINYNSDGFSISENHYDESLVGTDGITITDKKAKEYYTVNTNDTPTLQTDTRVININLPSLGNSVATLYNCLYGTDREQDVTWGQGVTRMIETDPNGNGYTFTPEKSETFVGAINSAHDLMGGKIIKDGMPEDPKEGSSDWIYYNKKDASNGYAEQYFYRKGTDYELIPINSQQELDTILNNRPEVQLNGNYEKGRYHTTDDTNFYLDNSIEPSDGKYYDLSDNNINKIKVNLHDFDKNDYYVKVSNGYELVEKVEDTELTKPYYTIVKPDKPLVDNKKSLFFNPSLFPDNDAQYAVEGKYQNVYFYKGENTDYEIITKNYEKLDEHTYYKVDILEVVPGDGAILHYKINGKPFEEEIQKYQITFIDYDEEKQYFYYLNNNFYNADINTTGNIYIITIDEKINSINIWLNGDKSDPINRFYRENTFHFYNKPDYYLVSSKDNINNSDKEYYYFHSLEAINRFYRPNAYEYYDNGEWILDKDLIMTEGRKYYDPLLVCIAEDNEYYRQYEIYNYKKYGFPDPKELKIAIMKPIEAWKLLDSFSDKYNTIGGAILKVNNFLEQGDIVTRDQDTIQGSLNCLNDIIHKLDNLDDGKILITNKYGTITETDPVGDEWIDVKIDQNAIEPQLRISHKSAGTLPLGDRYKEAEEKASITVSDTINSAFGKVQKALNIINGDSSIEGSISNQIANIVEIDGGAIDKLKEISKWIVDEDAGAAKIISDLSEEITRSTNKDNDLQNQVNGINNTIGSIDKDKTIAEVIASAIKKAEEELTEEIEDRETAVQESANNIIGGASENYNTLKKIEDRITDKSTGLEQADYTLNSRCDVLDRETKELGRQISKLVSNDTFTKTVASLVSNEDYQKKVAELELADHNLNSRCNNLDTEVKGLINNAVIMESGLAQSQKEIENLTSKITELWKYIETLEKRIQELEG